MDTRPAPIVTSTTLSAVLHLGVFIGILWLYQQADPATAVGSGLQLELVSAETASLKFETEASSHVSHIAGHVANHAVNQAPVVPTANHEDREAEQSMPAAIVATHSKSAYVIDSSEQVNDHFDSIEQVVVERDAVSPKTERTESDLPAEDSKDETLPARSTAASQHQHAILELLHSSINQHKEYPYLARRQRREGISTVAFVLYPDGSIENTHLVQSSNTVALDRAALSAVERIAPFSAAQDYLDAAEQFKIDIVFELL
jgi:periplasmic protein TonB